MNGWVLGPQALSEFVEGKTGGRSTRTVEWAKTGGAGQQLYVTSPSWVVLRSHALGMTNPRERTTWLKKIDQDLKAEFGTYFRDLGSDHLELWSELMAEDRARRLKGPETRVTQIDLMNAAFCKIEGLGYVDRSEVEEVFEFFDQLGVEVAKP